MCRFHVFPKRQRGGHRVGILSSPTGSINLGLLNQGKFALCCIIPSSWGSQLTCDVQAIVSGTINLEPPTTFSGAVAGENRIASARGVSHTQSLYFVICLA